MSSSILLIGVIILSSPFHSIHSFFFFFMHFADAVWSSKAFPNSGVLKCVCPVERVKSSTLELILWFQHCDASDIVTARSLRDFERERVGSCCCQRWRCSGLEWTMSFVEEIWVGGCVTTDFPFLRGVR